MSDDYPAPDCANGIRPCPFVSCRHNLLLDVATDSYGYEKIILNLGRRKRGEPGAHPDNIIPYLSTQETVERLGDMLIERLDECPASCAIDEAIENREAGFSSLEVIGQQLGVTRERVRQIEREGLKSLATKKVILEEGLAK